MRCIYPYSTKSKSANSLAEAMGIPIVGKDIDLRRGGSRISVINWGSGEINNPAVFNCRIINHPTAVMRAINKANAFEAFSRGNVRAPEHTTNIETARAWLRNRTKVIARTQLEGRDGAGVVLVGPTDGWTAPVLPPARLYTKFIPSRAEYRVNTTRDKSVGVQLKVHDTTKRTTSEDIRTGGNGWAFRLLNENEIPRGLRPAAKSALAALGLDFGGVDIIHGTDGNFYVLEVNTAPELTPSMVRGYASQLAQA